MLEKKQLLLSAFRGLLFNIIAPVRFIFMQIIDNRLIITIYSDRELNELERDIYHAVSGEISGDFIFLDDSLSEVNFIVTNKTFETIKESGDLVFARYE